MVLKLGPFCAGAQSQPSALQQASKVATGSNI